MNRNRLTHFPRLPDAPVPVQATVRRTTVFSDVDPMGYVWFGRYPLILEGAVDALNKQIGLSYAELAADCVINPVAELKINYLLPIHLGTETEATACLVWTEATKLQYEVVIRSADGVHAVAWATNLFVDSKTGEVYLYDPPCFSSCREKWKSGAFRCLQQTNG